MSAYAPAVGRRVDGDLGELLLDPLGRRAQGLRRHLLHGLRVLQRETVCLPLFIRRWALSDSTAFLTFLVSLLGPSLCSPEAPPAEEDDPDAAVAAVAAEPEADITPLARSTKSSFVSLSPSLF